MDGPFHSLDGVGRFVSARSWPIRPASPAVGKVTTGPRPSGRRPVGLRSTRSILVREAGPRAPAAL